MSDIMLASEMTDGQIDDLANKLRDAARKHRGNVDKDSAQGALRSKNIGMTLFSVFRKLSEEMSKQIVHVVVVNRKRTVKDALSASGRTPYLNDEVVKTMPNGAGDKVRLVYFKPDISVYKDGYLSFDALTDEYEKRGLVPDPQAQIDDNAVNPAFADETHNACQWQDANGNYCFIAFDRWFNELYVSVNQSRKGWNDSWWFAGVSK